MIKSAIDRRWYSFRWACDVHVHSACNLYADEEMHGCIRPDKNGIPREKHSPALCKVHSCPILKGKMKLNKYQQRILGMDKDIIEVEK